MIINNNISSIRSQGALFHNNRALGTDLQRLSTGLRVNSASDDAAGLAISEKLRTQIRGQEQAKRNTLDGISALSIADGAMNEIHNILQRQRELAVQAANVTNGSDERTYIKDEIVALNNEIARIIDVTKFNGRTMLASGTDAFAGGGSGALQVDANSNAENRIVINLPGFATTAGTTNAIANTHAAVATEAAMTSAGTDAQPLGKASSALLTLSSKI